MLDIFQRLKKKDSFSIKEKKTPNILFQINFENNKSYLSILDEKTKEETNANYKYYTGSTRQILKALENIKEKTSFSFDWLESSDKIYFQDHEFLLEYLKNSTNLVNSGFEKITFEHDKAEITLLLEEENNKIVSKIVLSHEDKNLALTDFLIVTENYALVKDKIYPIDALGSHLEKLEFFQTTIKSSEIEKFLSLVYSYFDTISINYNNYSISFGNTKETKPTLLFEKIDEVNNLYIRVSESIENFEPDFLEDYEINKLVTLNNLENKIVIAEIERHNTLNEVNELTKLLNKHKKALKENNDYSLEENLFIIEENLAKEFIHKELTNLLEKFVLFGSEKLKQYDIRTVMPKLKLTLNHGLDFFEGEASLEIEDQIISLFDAINFYKKNSYIKLSDGSSAIVNKAYIDKLSRILKKSKNKVKLSFFDLPIIEELIEEKIFKENFNQYREVFLGFNELNNKEITVPKVKAELRNYQKQGLKWLDYLHKNDLGGCLADDMGLGKTLQTIALLSSIYPKEKKSTLIVMPKSLLYNWENEIKKFNPKLSYYIYYSETRDLKEAKEANLIITTYGTLRVDIEKFKNENFYYVILDESQNIKNVNSQISKAVMLLKTKHRLALSGTPIENNLSELYSLFRFLNPPMFGAFEDFNESYLQPIQKDSNKEVINELRKKIYPFILRRLKKDVLKDLPPKIEQTLYVEMSEEQKRLYEQRRAYYHQNLKQQIASDGINKAQFLIFQALSELRQIASIPEVRTDEKIISPKREILLEYITDVVSMGHKVLIFTNYLGGIEYISQDLNNEGIEFLSMTGATKDRQELVDKFQNNQKYKVLLMTLKTGGIGLNLTKADYVFIYDPWWNKSAENQAIDRAHRIGQDKTVFSYKLITRDTIEEKILQLQEMKTDLFNQIISSDDASIKSLSEDDIDFILG